MSRTVNLRLGIAGIALLTLGGIGWTVMSQSGDELLQQAGRQICADCGGNGNPSSISADGRFLLFSGRRFYGEPSSGVFIRDTSTGEVTQVLTEPSFAPVLSKDGKQIAYLGTANPNATFTSEDPSGTTELRVVANQVGAKPRVVHHGPERVIPAAWAPDGKSILAVLLSDEGYAIGWVSASDGTIQVLKSLRGRFGCCHDGMPSLSPDGSLIAYHAIPVTHGDGSHIYVLSADGSVPEVELVRGGSNWSPVWMPDGEHLLFVSDRGGRSGLWSAAVTDGALTPIQAALPVGIGPSNAYAGTILSVGMANSGRYFYTRDVLRTAGSTFSIQQLGRPLPGAPIFRGDSPTWSPGGASFAFLGSVNDERRRAFPATLHVYSLETQEERRYVPGGTLKLDWYSPQWFHDGKSVFVWVEESESSGNGDAPVTMLAVEGKKSPYRVDLATGAFTRIAEIAVKEPEPVAISPDDSVVYIVVAGGDEAGRCSADATIVAVDLPSGEKREVLRVPNTGIVLAADNRTLYMRACGGGRIVSVDIATGAQRDVFVVRSGHSLMQNALAVSPDSRTLAIVTEESSSPAGGGPTALRSQRLMRIRADGTGYKELFTLMGGATGGIGNVSWSRDGAEVFFEQRLISERVLLRIPADGGVPRAFARTDVVSGTLSPDASHVMVPRDRWIEQQLWVLDDVPSLLKAAR